MLFPSKQNNKYSRKINKNYKAELFTIRVPSFSCCGTVKSFFFFFSFLAWAGPQWLRPCNFKPGLRSSCDAGQTESGGGPRCLGWDHLTPTRSRPGLRDINAVCAAEKLPAAKFAVLLLLLLLLRAKEARALSGTFAHRLPVCCRVLPGWACSCEAFFPSFHNHKNH